MADFTFIALNLSLKNESIEQLSSQQVKNLYELFFSAIQDTDTKIGKDEHNGKEFSFSFSPWSMSREVCCLFDSYLSLIFIRNIYECTSQMQKVERDIKSLVKRLLLFLVITVIILGLHLLLFALTENFFGSKSYVSAMAADPHRVCMAAVKTIIMIFFAKKIIISLKKSKSFRLQTTARSCRDLENLTNLTITILLVQVLRLFIEVANVIVSSIQLEHVYNCKKPFDPETGFCIDDIPYLPTIIMKFIDLRSCSLIEYLFIMYQVFEKHALKS